MSAFLSQAWFASCCQRVSGCCTTPMSWLATMARTYAGRRGGAASLVPMSGMAAPPLFLDASGEQHVVNAVAELASARGIGRVAAVAVELALDLAGMRREQQNAVADQHRLRNRVGDEQHGEAGVRPELQQLLLHLAPGQRIERGERRVPPQQVRRPRP